MTLSNIGTQSTAQEFPATLQAKIDACPGAGGGLHPKLSTVACELRHNVDAERGFEILRDLAIERGCSARRAKNEARELIKKWNGGPVVRTDRTAVETKANVELIRDIVAKDDGGLAELRDQSPIKVDATDDGAADDIVNLLFPNGDIIYVARSEYRGIARTHAELYARGIRLHEHSHIVPNPMRERHVYDADGKTICPRRMTNVAYRRWLVLDFDTAKFAKNRKTPTFWKPLIEEWEAQGITPKDAQSRLIAYLSNFEFRLGMIVDTGGKSLHPWFAVASATDAELCRFMRHAINVGADHATWTVNQLVRMPHGTRDDGSRQLVQYLDTSVLNSNFKRIK